MSTARANVIRLVLVRRVSTADQVIDGFGLETQEEVCRKYAKLHGEIRIVHVVTDGDEKSGMTGKSTLDEREGLMDAIQWISDGKADGIIAANLDRVARELTVQEAILSVVWAHDARVFTADRGELLPDDDDDPYRTFVRQVMGAAAQLERGLIVKRLKGGRRTKAAKGGYAYGAPRFGQQAKDKELVDLPEEKSVEDKIREWHDEDGMGIRAITNRLNDEGIPAKRGGRWHPSAVSRILSPEAREKARLQAERARAHKKDETRRARAARLLAQQ